MEMIKTAAFNGCIAGLVICAAGTIAGEEKFASQIKLIFSAFFILVTLSAFRGADFEEIFSGEIILSESSEEAEKLFDEKLKEQIRKNTEYSLKEKLHALGVSSDSLHAEIETGDDGVKLVLVSVTTDNPTAAEKILREELGEETEIILKRP